MADCIFCGIVAGDVPATIVDTADGAVAFEDVNPKAPVHVLVIPREHLTDVHAIRDGDLLVTMHDLAQKVARDRGVADSGYRLVFNLGPDAGQSVFHAHLHVLGGRSLAWPPG
ncbi:MAG: histidine triad nucleotide-binding protein [Candidatus Dormibacteraeota bacterium]|nr:histidine triad nucleotide-binding protein [Candidatus Dormibacteraeota bacterium]MBO0761061.1 histidine triad nucleotide-binding protein [Candidatus Dormibacteraeota bacterium]